MRVAAGKPCKKSRLSTEALDKDMVVSRLSDAWIFFSSKGTELDELVTQWSMCVDRWGMGEGEGG